MLRRLWSGPRWLLCTLLVVLVRLYQYLIRPLLPPSCRFVPG